MDAHAMAQALLGPGMALNSATYTGADGAAGLFSNFTTGPWVNPITGQTGITNIASGVILTSGLAACGAAIFDGFGCSTANNTPGDPALDTWAGYPTQDAATLEFTFQSTDPNANTAFFNFLFASTEYEFYVNSPFNDVFAFLLNDQNIALIPGSAPASPVEINSVNVGNSLGGYPPDASNPGWFTQYSLPGVTPFNWGGATRVFQLSFPIQPGMNTIRLAIADASDPVLDSAVLIQGGTFATAPIEVDEDVVPEPATVLLLSAGVLILIYRRGRV